MTSNIQKVNFDEARQSQLPFVELLINLGYEYISVEEALKQRRNDPTKFILRDIAAKKLAEINTYEHKGETYKFSDKDIADAIEELENPIYEGLIDTSKTIFNLIMPTTGGKSIRVFHDGKSISKNLRFIDFANPQNNAFHITVEFPAEGKGSIRPDIVVFVNGIPFAVIENKKSSREVVKGAAQLLAYQQADKCPRLFTYPQILVTTNKDELRYGTTGTQPKFYAEWKEKDKSIEEQNDLTRQLIATPVRSDWYVRLCFDLNGATAFHKQVLNRIPTAQDRGVVSLFKKERLLDLSKNFILYDAGVKKLARYQQYFAIKKTLDRIEVTDDAKKRSGGLVWHTQGSGKSLTMVMFVKALIDHPHINNPRVIVVTDRRDLDKQISETFKNCGLKKEVHRTTSGEDLLRRIKDKDLSVITTLVHKFEVASRKKAGFIDDDRDIFILVDEAHRTQGGLANASMERTLPNACYIAFTGTPLMKKEKASYLKFGGYIDKYTIDDAIRDKVILPLIYEGRYVDLEQNAEQINRHMERMTDGLSDAQKKKIQHYIDTQVIKDNPQRIGEIAYDIAKHYTENFQGTGLKGQIVAPSKYSAIIFQRFFERETDLRTAVVISGESPSADEDDTHKNDVVTYLKGINEKYRGLESYENDVIESFKNNEDGVELLIVVSKLLTGFDAPCDTVLYLAKDLKDHGLLQAIARVNRLYDNEMFPKTTGFIIDYSENAKNLDHAMKLFGNFAAEDVNGTLVDVSSKIQQLEENYDTLHEIFKGLPADDEAFILHLEDEAERRMFHDAYNEFVKTFNECLALKGFASSFKHIDTYKTELMQFTRLRSAVRLRYAEDIDLNEYKKPLVHLLDKYIDAKGVELMTAPVDITDPDRFSKAIESLGTDKSKAEAIAAHTKRTIRERMEQDPEFYKRFSEKIEEVLSRMREGKLADAEALGQMRLLSDEIISKKDTEVPERIKAVEGAAIYYRNLKEFFESLNLSDEQYESTIIGLVEILKKEAIVDWYRNAEVIRIIANRIDDFLYDYVRQELNVALDGETTKQIVDKCIELARNNTDIYSL